jgi:phosphoglycolate phosphatase-like HAD superfamily hydrolase
VFDTMERKQKRCFHGRIVSHWRLEPIAAAVHETAEFVTLYSRWRGQNRFTALLRTFDLLRRHPSALASAVHVPALDGLRSWVASGAPLSNASLEGAVAETRDRELASVLRWSRAVNDDIARYVKAAPPFRWVRESLQRIRETSDAVCVSQTPTEALVREWEIHGLTPYVAVLAGQELGSKAEHIALATRHRYDPDRVLMIGDAIGDREAAAQNRAHFYPICPGREAASWKHFIDEAFDRFIEGQYAGDYEAGLIAAFEALLPAHPPWEAEERARTP